KLEKEKESKFTSIISIFTIIFTVFILLIQSILDSITNHFSINFILNFSLNFIVLLFFLYLISKLLIDLFQLHNLKKTPTHLIILYIEEKLSKKNQNNEQIPQPMRANR